MCSNKSQVVSFWFGRPDRLLCLDLVDLKCWSWRVEGYQFYQMCYFWMTLNRWYIILGSSHQHVFFAHFCLCARRSVLSLSCLEGNHDPCCAMLLKDSSRQSTYWQCKVTLSFRIWCRNKCKPNGMLEICRLKKLCVGLSVVSSFCRLGRQCTLRCYVFVLCVVVVVCTFLSTRTSTCWQC